MTAKILVFGRAPVPGRVKTRLIPEFGADGATRVYRLLLERTLRTAAQLSQAIVEFWHADPDDGLCATLAARFGATAHTQQGTDLGDRMYNAMVNATADGSKTILIGSDVPDYSTEYLTTAVAGLRQHDAIIGPANDGGYVLIGLRRADMHLFRNIAWGTDQVLEKTRTRLRDLGLSHRELPVLRDVDTVADLKHYPALLAIAKQEGRLPCT